MQQKIYIRSSENISPQRTFGAASFPSEVVEYIGNKLNCIEPDYNRLIDPKLIRRMSRIIRMGVASATSCLKNAGISMPDAIITGTAYGCLEDTEVFLRKMIENKEEMLTPTAFIQSTHNTVGAQIALMLKCHQYNNTFVHKGFSFESALLDAILLLEEKKSTNVLVGGVDEITETSHAILTRIDLYKQKQTSNLHLLQSNSKGTMAGEGATFFSLMNQSSPDNEAQLNGIRTFYKPGTREEVENNIQSFLKENQTDISEMDLVITGMNGDKNSDQIYHQLNSSLFKNKKLIHYKHLCGEYATATAFALWLAGRVIKNQGVPEWIGNGVRLQQPLRRVLIYNHYKNTHHSLFLLSAC
jgi:3-oxoacyl-[acyl-carrier-protein] synthase II